MATVTDIGVVQRRADDLQQWLRENAPECFMEQKHTVEGTQERIYWHHGYMMGLRDALRLIMGDDTPSSKSHTRDKSATSFSA